MIAEIAGGEVLSGLADVYPTKATRGWIWFRRPRYALLTGLTIELGEAERILRGLGFTVEADVENDRLRAMKPTWRVDVSIEEGFDRRGCARSPATTTWKTRCRAARARALICRAKTRGAPRTGLTALGYNEAVSFSFVNGEADELLSERR